MCEEHLRFRVRKNVHLRRPAQHLHVLSDARGCSLCREYYAIFGEFVDGFEDSVVDVLRRLLPGGEAAECDVDGA